VTIQELFIINLKTYRKINKISQTQLADLCNSSTGYIGEIESGKRFPSVSMIERLASALKIDSWRLFCNEPVNHPELKTVKTLAPARKKEILRKADTALQRILDEY